VLWPPGEQAGLTRYAIPYFCRPDVNTLVKRLEGTNVPKRQGEEEEEALPADEWFKARVRDAQAIKK
jgi:isopenicillin N synthase-like dioxygenase